MITEGFSKRFGQLVEYTFLSNYEFAKEIGLTSQRLISNYISGKSIPREKTLQQIYARYPIRKEWFESGEGEMWERDYYAKRFYSMNDFATTKKQKIEFLMLIFENNQSQLAERTGLSKTIIRDLLKEGVNKQIKRTTIDKLCKSINFIPRSWYYIKY